MALTPMMDDADDLPLPALVGRLIDDARDVARAELAVYKAKAGERVTAYKGAAIFFVVAAVLALAALGALLVGLILTIATLVGPGFATLTVVGVVLVLAGIFALVGKSKLAAMPGEGL